VTRSLSAALLATLLGATSVAAAAPALPGRWVPAGTMSSDRRAHTATLLADGTVLVLGGGVTDGSVSAQADLFDPATGAWSRAAPMPGPRVAQTAVRLRDGRVLVVGGITHQFTPPATDVLSSSIVYDPASRAWTAAGPLPVAVLQPVAVLMADGRVLVAGGSTTALAATAAAEILDPASMTWRAVAPMRTPRMGAVGFLLRSGRVLVAGGAPSDQDGSLDSTEVFDPASGTWSPGARMGSPHALPVGVALADGTLMVAGGQDFQGGYGIAVTGTDLYDQSSGRWTDGPPLNTGRAEGAGDVLSDGRVLVTGGFRVRVGVQALSSAEIYDPRSRAWSPVAPMSDSRTAHALTALPGGRALVTGGDRHAEAEVFLATTGGGGTGATAARTTSGGGLPGGWPLAAFVVLVAAVGGQQAYRRLRAR